MLHTIRALAVVGFFLLFSGKQYRKVRRMPEGRERDLYVLHTVQDRLRKVLRVSGVSFEIEGLENIPENEAVLFVGNHRSFFDVILSYTLVKGPTGFIAKKEIERVGVLNRWMRELHCLFLDRENLKQNLKVILEGIKLLRNGVSIWIYPEGTRSKGEDIKALLPFKEGSFKLAEKSGCKIIPVAMLGTRELFEAQFPRIRSGHVYIRIGEPIVMKELPEEDRQRIGEYTRGQIIRYLAELEKKRAAAE